MSEKHSVAFLKAQRLFALFVNKSLKDLITQREVNEEQMRNQNDQIALFYNFL